MRRAQKIKMRLGASNDPLEPFPRKARGMHWRTYRRLRDEAHAAEAEADGLLAESIPAPGQFLGPVPPRRKRQRGRRDGSRTGGLPGKASQRAGHLSAVRPSTVAHAAVRAATVSRDRQQNRLLPLLSGLCNRGGATPPVMRAGVIDGVEATHPSPH
jgi:hypothetical protein